MISAFSNLRSHLKFRAVHDPVRDWLALITLAALLLVGILVWNVWAFDTAASGGVIGGASAPSPALFDQASIESIRTLFVNRAAEAAKYNTGVYRYADPSQ